MHTPPPPLEDGSDAFDDEVQEVLAGLGVNPSGTVDQSAFVAAVSQLVCFVQEQGEGHLWQTFQDTRHLYR